MDGLSAVVMMVAIIFISPVLAIYVVMSFLTRKSKIKRLSECDEQKIGQLTLSTQSLAKRLSSLETILENEVPDWRNRLPKSPAK
ncbi:MAG: hypothetical protein AB8G05_16040 [Oligoflexales bacterium]